MKVRPVLIESKEPTGISLFPNNKLFWTNEEGIFKQLIFISLKDGIVDNNKDRYFESSNGMIKTIVNAGLLIKTIGTYHSIVTLQSQIPTTYIQQFIEENKGSGFSTK